jgi:hypothetical protein
MPPLLFLGCALLGAALVAAGALWMRAIGARMVLGRRLAGARELPVGQVAALAVKPARPIRVVGRIRCPDPLVAPDGEELVAYHRDVEVQTAGGWRPIERLRETRSFELWDHGGSLSVDPALVAEPLVTIPLIWEGSPDELGEPHASAVARLAAEGAPPLCARAVTRTISVVDRLLLLAEVRVDGPAGPRLEPPEGGFIISTLELEAAMRLLGGPRRRQLAFAIGAMIAGAAVALLGLTAALLGWIATR